MENVYHILSIYATQHFLPFLTSMLLFQTVFCWRATFKRWKKIVLFLAVPVSSIINFLITIILMQNSVFIFHIYAVIELGIYLLLAIIFFKENSFKKIFVIIQFVVIAWLLRFACVNLFALIDGYYLSIDIHYFATSIANVLALCFSRYIATYIKKHRFEYEISTEYWIVIYIFTAVEYFCGIMINDLLTSNQLLSSMAIVLQVGLLVIIILLFHIFLRLCSNYQKLIQQSLITKKLQLQKQHFIESRKVYDELREIKHEFKNQIFYMDYLLEKKDYDVLHQYFLEYSDNNKKFDTGESGNDIINAVLKQKQIIAQQNNIELDFNASCIPEETAIEDIDLCTVLSNLLDNAIEGCQDLPNAKINALMRMEKNYLHIVIQNSVAENVLEQNPTLQTRKENKMIHGIGLKVVHAIVEKYNGIINFQCDNVFFQALISLQEPGVIK